MPESVLEAVAEPLHGGLQLLVVGAIGVRLLQREQKVLVRVLAVVDDLALDGGADLGRVLDVLHALGRLEPLELGGIALLRIKVLGCLVAREPEAPEAVGTAMRPLLERTAVVEVQHALAILLTAFRGAEAGGSRTI